MQVSGLNNAQITDFTAAQHQHEADIARFQTLFNDALERRGEAEEIDRAAIRNAAEMFESYFINLMFREMRRTTENEHTFMPKSNAERIFTEMLDEEMSNQAAAAGGFGLADMIYRQMTMNLDRVTTNPDSIGRIVVPVPQRNVYADEME